MLRVRVAAAFVSTLDGLGRHDEVIEYARAGLAESDGLEDDRAQQARMILHFGLFCSLKRRPREMAAYLRAIEPELRAAGDHDEHARAMLVELGMLDAATGAADAVTTIARMRELLGGLHHVNVGVAACALLSGGAPPDEALDALDAFSRERAAIGDTFGLALALLDRAGAALLRGRLTDAAADVDRALDLAATIGPDSFPMLVAIGTAIRVDVARGDLVAARAHAARLGPLGIRAPEQHARVACAELRLADGDAAGALADLEAVGAHLDAAGFTVSALECGELWRAWRPPAVRALVALGRVEEARALAEVELAAARRFGAPRAIGVALTAVALAHHKEISLLEEAVALLSGTVARLDHATALADLAEAVLATNHHPRARELAREAQELAEISGAAPLAARALKLRVKAGGRPRRRAERGAASLTPAERRVATLAATGRTNREIAQELYLTPKTVELHLSSVFRKLGIKGRAQLRRPERHPHG